MNIRFHVGQLAAKNGYKIVRDYKFPETHGNLLQLGLALLKAKVPGPIQVVQVGAFDGQFADPLAKILQDERVTAVLVEPQKKPFESLTKRYASNSRIRLVNGVVAAKEGKATLYVPSEEGSPQASLDASHYRRFGIEKSNVREVEVRAYSVASLLKECGLSKINVLQLDTEGMDYQILQWFFDAGQQPEIINFESLHLSKEERLASRKLLTAGYWWFETEQDTFAVKESLISD